MTQAPAADLLGQRKRWRIAPPTQGPDLGVTPLAAHLLRLRGVGTPSEATEFMDVADSLYLAPSILTDVGLALDRLREARNSKDPVAVYGDFDADGVTGTAVMVRAFQRYGLSAVPYIPHRVAEGHGLNIGAIETLGRQGIRLIVTVDCGVTDVDAIAHANRLGIDVIVTDHHTPGERTPNAVAIVNPKAAHSDYAFDQLTGVGLALKLAHALLEGEPDWGDGLLELAAIGTITDMAPLLGENRYIVHRGLQELRRTRNVGLRALMASAKVDPEFANAESIGFGIGPRLNAAGRLGHADTAYELLMTTDPARAQALSAELEGINQQRRDLTGATVDACLDRVDAGGGPGALIMLGDEKFNPGIVGLAAGRLAEQYGVPAVVYALEGGVAMASCRGAPGFDWAQALRSCDDLLTRYGGHAQAAGFSCPAERLGELQARLEAVAAEWLDGKGASTEGVVDAEAGPASVMGETFRQIQRMEPFGMGNPAPVFLARGIEVVRVSTMGAEKQHFRLSLRDGGVVWDAVAFRQEWVQGTRAADIVYTIGIDHWQGRERLRLTLHDYAPSA